MVPQDVPMDRDLLASLLADLSAALVRRGHHNQDLSRLSATATKDSIFLEQLASHAAFHLDGAFLTSLAEQLKIGFDALLFFGRVLGAPFVTEAVRRHKRRAAPPPESSGCCPWCGSPPGLAALSREEGSEGRRVLFCSLCGEHWPFARIPCPFCASQRQRSVLSFDEADPHTIETCDQCHGYLKTIDERKLPEGQSVVPLAETTATLYLDLIAEERGCARAIPYAALR